MLKKLFEAERKLLSLLKTPALWNTLDVLYHPPHVERVWCQWNEYRISLHKIYPCAREEALIHVHPWPSAIYIASGKYEMGVSASGLSEQSARLILPAGTYYEMINESGSHYVRPLKKSVMSVMLSGKPWKKDKANKTELVNQPLAEQKKNNILFYFRTHYHLKNLHGLIR